jgi:hypothetical protein
MKTQVWLWPIELAAHLEGCDLSAKGATQLEPGATPQGVRLFGIRAALKARFNYFNATRM